MQKTGIKLQKTAETAVATMNFERVFTCCYCISQKTINKLVAAGFHRRHFHRPTIAATAKERLESTRKNRYADVRTRGGGFVASMLGPLPARPPRLPNKTVHKIRKPALEQSLKGYPQAVGQL